MANQKNEYHTNDSHLGWYDGKPALFETESNHTDSNGNQLHDIFYSGQGTPLGVNHGHVVTDSSGDVLYSRDESGNVTTDIKR